MSDSHSKEFFVCVADNKEFLKFIPFMMDVTGFSALLFTVSSETVCEELIEKSVKEVEIYFCSQENDFDLVINSEKTVDFSNYLEKNKNWYLKSHEISYEMYLSDKKLINQGNFSECIKSVDIYDEIFVKYIEILDNSEYIFSLSELNSLRLKWSNLQNFQAYGYLSEEGAILSMGILYKDMRGFLNIEVIGTIKGERGKGIGRQLHAVLLEAGSMFSDYYVGVTDASNYAMIKIFKANRCILLNETKIWKFRSKQYQ